MKTPTVQDLQWQAAGESRRPENAVLLQLVKCLPKTATLYTFCPAFLLLVPFQRMKYDTDRRQLGQLQSREQGPGLVQQSDDPSGEHGASC